LPSVPEPLLSAMPVSAPVLIATPPPFVPIPLVK